MEYNYFENILNAYFFKDMLQSMIQNHFFLENVNTLFWKRAVQDIIQYTYLLTNSVTQVWNQCWPNKLLDCISRKKNWDLWKVLKCFDLHQVCSTTITCSVKAGQWLSRNQFTHLVTSEAYIGSFIISVLKIGRFSQTLHMTEESKAQHRQWIQSSSLLDLAISLCLCHNGPPPFQ